MVAILSEKSEKVPARLVTIEELKKVISAVKKTPVPMGFDLETTGLNPRRHKIVTVNFGTRKYPMVLDARAYYSLDEQGQAQWKMTIQELVDAVPVFVGLNLKFDWEFLFCQWGIRLHKVADVMVQELVLHSVGWSGAKSAGVAVNMEDMASRYGFTVEKEMQKWSVDLDTKEEWNLPLPEEELIYVAQDVIVPLQIHEEQQKRLYRHDLVSVATLENAVLPAFAWMECCGCYIDTGRWHGIIAKLREEEHRLKPELEKEFAPHHFAVMQQKVAQYNAWLAECERVKAEAERSYMGLFAKGKVQQSCKQYCATAVSEWVVAHKAPKKVTAKELAAPLNLGSHTQVKAAFTHMGISLSSTDVLALAEFKANPVIEKLLKWKKLHKFLTTSGENILSLIDIDGRIHPEFAQVGAETGRTASFHPNWQNLPKEDDDHPELSIRRCIVGEGNNLLLTCDLPNIELRIAAELLNDPVMLHAFGQDKNLHEITAQKIFGLPDNVKPDKKQKQVGKTTNFGILYGQGASGLAVRLDVTKAEAETFIEAFKSVYRKASQELEELANKAVERGYSKTILGRKRFYKPLPPKPAYDSPEWEEYSRARGHIRREGKNSPIQGTSADIIKVALLHLYRKLPDDCKLINCVHDEVVVECPADRAEEVKKIVQDCMMAGCRKFLKRVAISEMDVSVEKFWKK